jgi:hypothetical protein
MKSRHIGCQIPYVLGQVALQYGCRQLAFMFTRQYVGTYRLQSWTEWFEHTSKTPPQRFHQSARLFPRTLVLHSSFKALARQVRTRS